MAQQNNYWFIATFSIVVVILSTLQLPFPEINAAIYASTVFALIGFTIIMLRKPSGFYHMYGDTVKQLITLFGLPSTLINLYVFNFIATVIHLAPVYFYRNTYSLGNPLPIMVIWLLFAFPALHKMYPFREVELMGIGGISYLLFLAVAYYK